MGPRMLDHKPRYCKPPSWSGCGTRHGTGMSSAGSPGLTGGKGAGSSGMVPGMRVDRVRVSWVIWGFSHDPDTL
jgi:hypothetical protein